MVFFFPRRKILGYFGITLLNISTFHFQSMGLNMSLFFIHTTYCETSVAPKQADFFWKKFGLS